MAISSSGVIAAMFRARASFSRVNVVGDEEVAAGETVRLEVVAVHHPATTHALRSWRVRIRRTLLRTPDGLTFAEPKTATSRRAIPIGAATVAVLRAHRQRQAEERLSDLVFSNTLGGPVNAGEMLRASFYPLLLRAGLPRIRFHDLRHTAATLMVSRGVHPKIVAERLGHSTPMLTLTVYSHVTPTMQRGAADELEALLSSRG